MCMSLQIPLGEQVVMIRPYFCFWKWGQQALTHCLLASTMARATCTDLVGTSQVDSHDLVPHLLVHVDKCLVPEDTSVGN